MPTVCCAIGCKHVTGNGVCHLKRFPNDEKRAVIWAENVRGSKWRRKGWELLCDCHFESSQFEKTRQDGAKKLRRNAIPTLFPTHTMTLDDSTTGFLEPSISLDCQYEPYDLEPLNDVGIQRFPESLLFPEEADFFDEVHFEASAYELHRADGLRKLKQNAVPTICGSNPIMRSKRKQIVQPRLEFPFDEGCDDPFIAEESEAPMPIEVGQFLNPTTYGCDFVEVHKESSEVKRLKTVHVMEIVSKCTSQENDVQSGVTNECNAMVEEGSESTSSESMGNTSEVLSMVKTKHGRHLKRRGRTKIVKKQCDELIIDSCGAMPETVFENEIPTCSVTTLGDAEEIVVRCFVCSKVIAPGFDVHLNVPAEASRKLLHQCLEAILSFESTVGCHEVVCRRCCSLLNYIDRTEAELTILKGAISTCTREKNEGQDSQGKSKLMKSEQILDRFSRDLGERNYMMDLEELFLEKTGQENTRGEGDPSHPLAVEDKPSSGEAQLLREESEMFTDENLNAEPFENGKDLGQMVHQERDEEETTARECLDQASSELLDLCEMVGTNETSKAMSEKGVESKTCSVLDDEVENYSKGESSERKAHVDDDLKHFWGGQQKTHQCKICCFKTFHESVMIWHLRVHMKTHRWCDFCSVAIPEQESVFSQLKNTKPPVKSNNRKSSSKHSFILPAVPVEPMTVSPIPLTSLNMPLLTLDNVSSESPVVLVDTQGLRNEFVPESLVEKGDEDSARMEESQDGGVVIVSENVLLSETPKLLQSSIPSINPDTSLIDKSQQDNYFNGTSLSPDSQENETLEIYCQILRPPTVEIGKSDNSDADVELSRCLNAVNCCNVDGSDVVESLSNEPCNIASNVCVHANDGLADSIETNFLDTLTSQPVAKYPEILPEICNEATDHNTVSSESGVTDDNITNSDVNFVRNNAIGESDLALAYENSVAALMCQSDDSDGILY